MNNERFLLSHYKDYTLYYGWILFILYCDYSNEEFDDRVGDLYLNNETGLVEYKRFYDSVIIE